MTEPFVANLMAPMSASRADAALAELRSRNPELLEAVESVFGDPAKAHRWLIKPRTIFGGQTPLDLAKTPEGEQRIRQTLVRIQYGIFS